MQEGHLFRILASKMGVSGRVSETSQEHLGHTELMFSIYITVCFALRFLCVVLMNSMDKGSTVSQIPLKTM